MKTLVQNILLIFIVLYSASSFAAITTDPCVALPIVGAQENCYRQTTMGLENEILSTKLRVGLNPKRYPSELLEVLKESRYVEALSQCTTAKCQYFTTAREYNRIQAVLRTPELSIRQYRMQQARGVITDPLASVEEVSSDAFEGD